MKKIAYIILAVLLAVVTLGGAYALGKKLNENKFSENPPAVLEPEDDDKNNAPDIIPVERAVSGSLRAGKGDEENLTLVMGAVAEADEALMNIPEDAESAIAVQAYVLPDYATDKGIEWRLSFVNPDAPWVALMEQEGLTIDDYVKIIPQGDNKVAIACMFPFGEQIELKVFSRANAEIYATISLDYEVRILKANLLARPVDSGFQATNYIMSRVRDNDTRIVGFADNSQNTLWTYTPQLTTTAATYARDCYLKARLNPEFVEFLEDAGIQMNAGAYQSFDLDRFKDAKITIPYLALGFIHKVHLIEGKDTSDMEHITEAVSAETLAQYKGAVNAFIASKNAARLVTFTYYYGHESHASDAYNIHFGADEPLFEIEPIDIETNPDSVVF